MKSGATSNNIVLYDADCRLCLGVVRFLTRRDGNQVFSFIPLESGRGRELRRLYTGEKEGKGSLILIEKEKIYTRSDAVFHILRRLDGMWPLLYILIVLPRFIRDPAYDIVARYRYRWFGSGTECSGSGIC